MHNPTVLNSSFLSQLVLSRVFLKWVTVKFLICLTHAQGWLQTRGTWASAAWLSQGCFPPGLLLGSLWLCVSWQQPSLGDSPLVIQLLHFHNSQWVTNDHPIAWLQQPLLCLDMILISEIDGLYCIMSMAGVFQALSLRMKWLLFWWTT